MKKIIFFAAMAVLFFTLPAQAQTQTMVSDTAYYYNCTLHTKSDTTEISADEIELSWNNNKLEYKICYSAKKPARNRRIQFTLFFLDKDKNIVACKNAFHSTKQKKDYCSGNYPLSERPDDIILLIGLEEHPENVTKWYWKDQVNTSLMISNNWKKY